MVRLIASLVGAAFVLVLGLALFSSVSGVITDPPEATAESVFHEHPKELDIASNGVFGKFDRRQVQRGFQVYKEVCAACHSIRLVSFRDLEKIGYSEPEVKAIASQWVIEQPSINPETGEPATRKNIPSDRFPSPFANEVAARAANNNALPPDLSLMTKARHDGAAYVDSLLTGYTTQPAALLKQFPDAKTPEGLHYNPYFANLNIAMPPPITSDGQVTYTDGTRATKAQMAADVSAFLVWTAEPNLESRHAAGLAAVIFILIFIGLAWGAYQNVWRNIEH
ncbi:cytochrome C [Sphingomonas sp. Leaf17]|uniref:cytochrome c1 n=1 Tax=Sphingomonas sp. Leaf17 TaxID=1735683 RepID=UPI0006FFC2B6|nr:cytochrome c1 [Sphingomonas sp. Leaf17]KQM63712.1 cytochrome C [Sphingomonas sp. Leaf17]